MAMYTMKVTILTTRSTAKIFLASELSLEFKILRSSVLCAKNQEFEGWLAN